MPTFDTLRQEADSRALVRKIQKAIAFIAPVTADLPETLFTADGSLVDLKAEGYVPVGLVTPDGYKFTREISKEDISALGYASPVRSDITTVARSVAFTALERGKRNMLELKYGVNLSNTQQSANGEVVFDEPDLPIGEEYRLVIIGSDGPAAENWILGRGYGRVKLASTGEENWGQEGAVTEEYTLDVFTDDEIGSPVRHYQGGTGAAKHKAITGFTAAA